MRAICAAPAGPLVAWFDLEAEAGAALVTGDDAAIEEVGVDSDPEAVEAVGAVDAVDAVDVADVAGAAERADEDAGVGVDVDGGVDAEAVVDVEAGVDPDDPVKAGFAADASVVEVDAGALCVAAGCILFFPDFSCRGGVFCILGLLKLDPAEQDRKPYRQ